MVTTSDLPAGGRCYTRWIHFWIARRVGGNRKKDRGTNTFRGGSDVIQYLRQSRNPCIITTGAFLPLSVSDIRLVEVGGESSSGYDTRIAALTQILYQSDRL